MDSTIIQQGRFISDGNAKLLDVRSDTDWMEVINETQFATTQTPGRGIKFEWQRGLSDGHAFEYTKADGVNTLQAEKITSGGFTLIDPNAGPSAPVTGTTITKANPPVCTANGHGFQNRDTVGFSNLVQMPQLSTYTFTIGNVTTNTFEILYLNTNTANFTAETAFEVRKFPRFEWKGAWNTISAVIAGSTTQVQVTSAEPEEAYGIGTILKFNVPAAYGMTQLNGLNGKILSYVSATNTYTIDIDSSTFTPFAFPSASTVPLSNATVVVVGSTSVNGFEDAVDNVQTLQIELAAGIDGPSGSASDVIYWRAGKSSLIDNE